MNAMTGWTFGDEPGRQDVIELDVFEDPQTVLAVCSPEEVEVLFSGDIILTPEQVEQVCQARLAAVDGPLKELVDRMSPCEGCGQIKRGEHLCWRPTLRIT